MTTLHRNADPRSYTVLSSADEIRALFAIFGFKHYPGNVSSIYSDRWTHDGPQGRTVLVYFADSARLSLLGPAVPALDALVADEAVTA
jgi:hypothetical protein